jgi:hypothetical protein
MYCVFCNSWPLLGIGGIHHVNEHYAEHVRAIANKEGRGDSSFLPPDHDLEDFGRRFEPVPPPPLEIRVADGLALGQSVAHAVGRGIVSLKDVPAKWGHDHMGEAFTFSMKVHGQPYFHKGRTIIGTGREADGSTRTVSLNGNRLAGIEDGNDVEVTGMVTFLIHPMIIRKRVKVPSWFEVRIEES